MKSNRTIRNKKKRNALEIFEKKKQTDFSYEESLLHILRQKKWTIPM